MKILTINPGGTSTKIALFNDGGIVYIETLEHDPKETNAYPVVFDQLDFRARCITEALEKNNISLDGLSAVVGRGGLMKPIPGGTYIVDEDMINDMKQERFGAHASNLGAPLAKSIAEAYGVPSYVVDPVSVDEYLPMIRLTGIPDIKKYAWLHPLNHKAVCRKHAPSFNTTYEDGRFIVAHLGSGISIAAHKEGRMVDGSGGRSDGPFSPERCGGLPSYPLVELCFSGQYTRESMVDLISNKAGFYAYLGTKDLREVEARIEQGDEEAKVVFDAFIYQCAKEISAYAAILEGRVDGIILTGGVARSKRVCEGIQKYVGFLAPVVVEAGELEMQAMHEGALRVLNGVEQPKKYSEVHVE